MRSRVSVLMTLACLALLPATAWAQGGSISGLVADGTGGVLPGVTVDATSPVLLSPVAAVADSSGRYTLTNLRPGTYTLTFSLDGFNRLVREGIVLSGESTIQVNVQMQVGAIEQSITVTGESPLVDVQSVREQFVVSREMMDTLPGTSTFSGRALLIPGVRNTGMTEGQYWPAAHGNTWRDAQTMNDGMRANVLIDDGQWQMGYEMNQAATAELAYEAGGAPAEVQTGGVLQNAIPKEGGNTFRGTFHTQFGHENLNGNNRTPELEALLGEVNRNAYNYNINPGYGGPIVQDRLWFYGAFLRRDNKEWVAGSKFTGEGSPELREKNGFGEAGTQGFNRGYANSAVLRFTNQVTDKHKWRVSLDRVNSTQPFADVTTLRAPESANRIPQPVGYHTQARWTSTMTNRLLVEAGFALQYNKWRREQFEWNETKTSFLDLTSNVSSGSYWITGNQPEYQRTLNASASYVTGSHNLKVGMQTRWGYFTLYNGPHPGDIRQHFTAAGGLVPIAVAVLSTPLDGFKAEINHDLGLYAQDTWTINRWTFNLGVRADIFKNGNPPQSSPAGSWVPARDFPALPAADWKTIVPRIGVAYDVFGDGKTAVKAYAHQYVNQESTTLALAVNPMASYTWGARQETRQWTDLDRNGSAVNADGTAQKNEVGPSNNLNFGLLADAAQFNVNDRPGQWEYNVSVQHELIPRLSVGMAYYRRSYFNYWREDNVLQSNSDWSPFAFRGPPDPRLNEFSASTQTLFNLSPTVFGQSSRVLNNVEDHTRVYDGLEWTAQGRFGRGGFFSGSINYEKTQENDCDVENRNSTIWCDAPRAWQSQFKANASYPIPKVDIISSVFVQGYPGPDISANYTATVANVLAQTGVALTGGATITYDLLPPDTYFLPFQTKMDLRFMRRFQIGTTRITPLMDIFNLLNANTTISINNTCGTSVTSCSPTWQQITGIMQARQLRFGLELDW
jgi:Carboxypeptidase regulatory-like domain